ncbi:Alpha/Beta hydrolase protein [Syncephalis plumigaleata]|nr:Alpha/Beta hydrolase protein [Syncephalis plumigaleata]
MKVTIPLAVTASLLFSVASPVASLQLWDGIKATINSFGPKRCADHILRVTAFEMAKRVIGITPTTVEEAVEDYTYLARTLSMKDERVTKDNILDNSQVFRYSTYAGVAYCNQTQAYALSGLRLGANHEIPVLDNGRILKWTMNNTNNFYVSVAESTKTITFVFRGTSSYADRNLVLDGKVVAPETEYFLGIPENHTVFSGMYRGAVTQFTGAESVLLEYVNKYPDYGIVLTGHSLGGTYAKLFALYLNLKERKLPIDAVYTYAEPISGTVEFSTWAAERIGIDRYVRITVHNDIVPNMRQGRNKEYGHAKKGIELYFPYSESFRARRCDSIDDQNCSISVPCTKTSWDSHATLGGFQYAGDMCILA